jgi:rhodanese-related sulfurtransferase
MAFKAGGRANGIMSKSLDKRVPSNPKYANVQGKLYTGELPVCSESKGSSESHRRSRPFSGHTVNNVSTVTQGQFLKRRDEPFRRVTAEMMCSLMMEADASDESVHSARGGYGGGGPMIVTHQAESDVQVDRPYLLLDVRPQEDWRAGHIGQSSSFPALFLHQDRISPELFSFKNKAETLIVVYDESERQAAQSATLLIEKGYENVFVLDGGFRMFAARFPGRVEGQMPEPPSPTKSARGGRGGGRGGVSSRGVDTARSGMASSRSGSASSQHSARSNRGPLQSSARSVLSGIPSARGGPQAGFMGGGFSGGQDDDTMSVRSDMSVAASVISSSSARKQRLLR